MLFISWEELKVQGQVDGSAGRRGPQACGLSYALLACQSLEGHVICVCICV